LLEHKRFFNLLAQDCIRFADRDTVYLVYMMMVGVIGQELRRHKVVRLPHLGDFGLVEQKMRPAWCGRMHVRMGPRDVLKFYPDYLLRRKFNTRQMLQ
jgi:nucleoid DNA-binding protein